VKPRIVKLIYQTYAPFQGRYPRVSGQAQILLNRGFEVTVLACDRDGTRPSTEILEGVRVVRITQKSGEMRGPFRQIVPLFLFWLRSLRWLRLHAFDILHCHNLDVLPAGWLVRIFMRRPVVFESHEPDYYALWPTRYNVILSLINAMERVMSKRVDCVSVTNRIQVKKYENMPVRQVMLIGNYPLPKLQIDEVPAEKFKRSTITFGRLGTIYPQTGFEASVAAFCRILRQYSNARFFIAGRVVENYEADFLRLIEPHRSFIEYIGPYNAEQMPELYRRIDVSLLVYPRNRWFRNITPRKFFDTLANGVPVIMTDIGGLGDTIKKHHCGLVVNEQDIETIFRAMRGMIESPDDRKQLAMHALKLSQTKFNWAKMAEKYVNLQNDLFKNAKG
jgi:glycosyltransferase involved in cell wall biosynthesis